MKEKETYKNTNLGKIQKTGEDYLLQDPRRVESMRKEKYEKRKNSFTFKLLTKHTELIPVVNIVNTLTCRICAR